MGGTREQNSGPDDLWQRVANAVGGKSIEEVKRHYEILIKDVNLIEQGQIPAPRYKGAAGICNNSRRNIANDDKRLMRNLNIQGSKNIELCIATTASIKRILSLA